MNNPKISVITTVYNVSQYIDKTIQSVVSQTFNDWEMILVNDCTQDDSVEKIQSYNDSRLVLINNSENIGAGKSRQVGIDNAKGEFILFLDGDDWLNVDCLEKLYDTAINENADIVNCRVNTIINKELVSYKKNPLRDDNRFTTFLSNKLIRKSLFEHTNYSPLRLFEDINTLYRLLHFSKKTVKINYVGYNYNIRPNSLTTTPNQQDKWLIYQALSIMENVDFFEGIEFKYKEKYNECIVMKLYEKISRIPESHKKEYIDEIETIRVWCENKLDNLRQKIRNKISLFNIKSINN